jgi:hypothetical protein
VRARIVSGHLTESGHFFEKCKSLNFSRQIRWKCEPAVLGEICWIWSACYRQYRSPSLPSPPPPQSMLFKPKHIKPDEKWDTTIQHWTGSGGLICPKTFETDWNHIAFSITYLVNCIGICNAPEAISSVYHNALRFWTIVYILSIRRRSSLSVRWLLL